MLFIILKACDASSSIGHFLLRQLPSVCIAKPLRIQASVALARCVTRCSLTLVFPIEFANRGFWTPWLHRLRAQGNPFVAVNLEPVFGSIDDYAPEIDAAVERVTQATGRVPVLVCHSMGGLAVRAWLRTHQADQKVHHIVTIGSPHGGTWLGRFSFVMNGQQMRLAGDWVTQLVGGELPGRSARFTCWYSNCDNIVFPASTATLPGANNRFVPGEAHVAMAFCPTVMDATFESLRTDRW